MIQSLVAEMLEQWQENLHTIIPGIISRVEADGLVTVTPSLGMMMANGQRIQIPDLRGVRLLATGTAAFELEMEPAEGDPVIILVPEADARIWASRTWGEPQEAASTVRHSLSSLVAIQLRRSGSSAGRILAKRDGSVIINGHLEVSP
jgi:hypothetical protein